MRYAVYAIRNIAGLKMSAKSYERDRQLWRSSGASIDCLSICFLIDVTMLINVTLDERRKQKVPHGRVASSGVYFATIVCGNKQSALRLTIQP
jgi:hypothetical protein